MADVTVPLGGWGYGNWDASEWGTNSPPLPLGTGQQQQVLRTIQFLMQLYFLIEWGS